jgi:hypothetical protein
MKEPILRLVASLASAALLAGCAPGKYLDVTDSVANFGQLEVEDNMRQRNMIAIVGWDETFVGNYNRWTRNVAWVQGAIEGTPEYLYRLAQVNMRFINGALWHPSGDMTFPQVVVVPDHIERLRAWDIVEVRHVTGRHGVQGFSTSGEGNIIVSVLCRKASPSYDKCAAALPHTGKYPGGSTNTPFPASVKSYGYTFTPAYDTSGKLVRSIPEYRVPHS